MKPVRLADALPLTLALLWPTLTTWVYFVLLANHEAKWQQAAYAVGKVVQFAWPVIWVFLLRRRPVNWQLPGVVGLGWGLGFGLLVCAHALVIYFGWMQNAPFMEPVAQAVQSKVAGLGLATPIRFLALGLFYALVHSLLEEYYWRWYVFGELRRLGQVSTAIGVSSFFFALHHVVLLAGYFGWQSPATWLFSAAVGVGGAAWALLYHRSGSLLGPWVSHLVIDAMIFAIGYNLASGVFK